MWLYIYLDLARDAFQSATWCMKSIKDFSLCTSPYEKFMLGSGIKTVQCIFYEEMNLKVSKNIEQMGFQSSNFQDRNALPFQIVGRTWFWSRQNRKMHIMYPMQDEEKYKNVALCTRCHVSGDKHFYWKILNCLKLYAEPFKRPKIAVNEASNCDNRY